MRSTRFFKGAVVIASAALAASALPPSTAAATESVKYPVYVVDRVGLTAQELTGLSRRLRPVLGVGTFKGRADGSVAFFSPASMAAGLKFSPVPASSVSTSQDDERTFPGKAAVWDVAYLKSASITTKSRAESILKSAIAGLNLGDDPAGAAAKQSELEIYNPKAAAIEFNGTTGTTVGRLSTLAGLPVTGPGQSIDLYFAADGKVGYANFNVRKIKSSRKQISVPVGSAAAQACSAAAGAQKGAAYSGTPVYYVSQSAIQGALIFPVLACSVVGIGDVVAQGFFVDVQDIDRPVGIDLGSTLLETFPGDEGSAEFGSAYLGDNARNPLNNACRDTDGDGTPDCPPGWIAQDYSQLNTDAFDTSMDNWGDQGLSGPDSVAPGIFVGGVAAQANAVDLMWYTGHASADGWQVNTGATPASAGMVSVDQVRLGQVDLEWLVIAACGPLQAANASGVSWKDRLTPMFQGLHQLLAYATISNTSVIEGQRFADYARGVLMPADIPSSVDARTFPIVWAWMFASIDAQPVQRPASPAVAATATTPARPARPAVTILGSAMGTQDSSGTVGTFADCLACGLPDQYPSTGASVWRLTWGT